MGSDVDIDDSKTDSKTKTHVPPPPQIKASIEDPSKIKEYTSWSIKEVQLKFSDTHLFRQLQDKLSLMLLGVSGVRFSVAIKSKQMDLIIQDSNIQDVASLMDILFKISDMFNEIRTKAGIKKGEFHDLRRTAITNWFYDIVERIVRYFIVFITNIKCLGL